MSGPQGFNMVSPEDRYMCNLPLSHVGGTIPVEEPKTGRIRNRCYFFSPDGDVGFQDKLHMTRFEKEEWIVEPGTRLKIFDTDFGKGSEHCLSVALELGALADVIGFGHERAQRLGLEQRPARRPVPEPLLQCRSQAADR